MSRGLMQSDTSDDFVEHRDGHISTEPSYRRYFSLFSLLSAMSDITVDIPEDAPEALKESPETTGATLRIAAAKLYELGRLSTGAAARLAGVPRSVFLTRLADYGVDTFDLTDENLDEETRLA